MFNTSKKVLVIEDDVLVAELLRDNLESLKYKIFVAYGGKTGWELAQKEQPDLVIADIGLPEIDGISLCKLIKNNSKTRHARIIMLTGKKMVGDMEDAFAAGAEAYVNKPFNWEHVLRHIQKLMPPEK